MRTRPWSIGPLVLVACESAGIVVPEVDHAAEGAWHTLACAERRKVDVLLVVEDSPAMAAEQLQVAEAARVLVEALDLERDTDYRLAVTNTHVNGAHCPARPGDGILTSTSCRARLTGFADDGVCLAECPLAGRLVDEPWLESISGRTNLAEGVDLGDAAACLAIQGLGGCEFPSPLAAMELALTRALDPTEPAYGFLRADAELFVAFIGVTADCSVAPAHVAIFDPDGGRRFWSDPTQPTPGVCWNAGVRCSGAPPEFDACTHESWDMSGETGASAGDAVLLPVERTVAFLAALVQTGSSAGVVVTALGGVPVGHDTGGVAIRYSTSCTPDTTTADGICPGCSSEYGAGTPPVRVAAVALAFAPEGEPRVASICSGDPTRLWAPLARQLSLQLRPSCVPACVADTDPATAVLEPRCEVVEEVPGEAPAEVPRCDTRLVDGALEATVPDGHELCHFILVDAAGLTPDTLDDLSYECASAGYSAELRLVRTAQPRDGACISVRCQPSANPAVDCPFLDD